MRILQVRNLSRKAVYLDDVCARQFAQVRLARIPRKRVEGEQAIRGRLYVHKAH